MSRKWSNEEIIILMDNYNLSNDELQRMLTNRNISAIQTKMSSLKLTRDHKFKKFTKEEVDFLKKNYFLPKEVLMEKLNKNWESIRKKLFALGIDYHVSKNKKSIFTSNWTDNEIAFLIDKYPNTKAEEIAVSLGKTLTNIYNKASRMGIKKDESYYLDRPHGEYHWSWKGDNLSETEKLRTTKEYRQWRKSVYERDNYTCQCCGDDSGGNLNAHHIENFSSNEENRFDISNGITLCSNCHDPRIKGSFHNIYGTRNNNYEQLEAYIKSKQLLFKENMHIYI